MQFRYIILFVTVWCKDNKSISYVSIYLFEVKLIFTKSAFSNLSEGSELE